MTILCGQCFVNVIKINLEKGVYTFHVTERELETGTCIETFCLYIQYRSTSNPILKICKQKTNFTILQNNVTLNASNILLRAEL